MGGARAHGPVRIEDRLARRGGLVELLRLPAACFDGIARLRGALYAARWLPVRSVETPVVSVGNLTAGGTGKTPFVAWLCRRLAARGLRPGLASRGYRPRAERRAAARAAASGGGDGEASPATRPNDEARMLARLLPDVPHVEDRDRVRGAAALEALGVDVIVLDDGFQHRRLARDLDLVLVDAMQPWGLPAVGASPPVVAPLPRGLLREPRSALRRAHALVLTRSDGVAPEALLALERELERWAPGVPRARAEHRPVRLRRLVDGGERPLAWLSGRTVDLVSGIGNPDAFERTVASLGATVAEHRRCGDHHVFTPGDLAGLGARPLLLTAKDAARLEGAAEPPWPAGTAPPETLVLDVELEVTAGEDELLRLLDGLPVETRRRERAALHGGLHG